MLRNKIHGIYRIRNLINGKVYIGSACDIEKRRNDHIANLNRNTHRNKYLQNAWNKYGESNFVFEIIRVIKWSEKQNLLTNEQIYLDLYESYNDIKGYNICSIAGNTMGRKTNELTRKNISVGLKNSKIFHDVINSTEYRNKLIIAANKPNTKINKSIALKNSKKFYEAMHNERYSKKMSNAKKGLIPWNKNKQLSEEYKQKIHNSSKGQIPWNKGLNKNNDCRLFKISQSRMGSKYGIGNHNTLNHKLTTEHKNKIGMAIKKKNIKLIIKDWA